MNTYGIFHLSECSVFKQETLPKTSNLIKPLQADSINVNKALDLHVTKLRDRFNTEQKYNTTYGYIVTYVFFNLELNFFHRTVFV